MADCTSATEAAETTAKVIDFAVARQRLRPMDPDTIGNAMQADERNR
jgi:hypothetical protein